MIPLNLTCGQQDCLADFCSLARRVRYAVLTNGLMGNLEDQFMEILERWDFTPQEFDAMYDKLHRTGANA